LEFIIGTYYRSFFNTTDKYIIVFAIVRYIDFMVFYMKCK